jgi:hypothetical protein
VIRTPVNDEWGDRPEVSPFLLDVRVDRELIEAKDRDLAVVDTT